MAVLDFSPFRRVRYAVLALEYVNVPPVGCRLDPTYFIIVVVIYLLTEWMSWFSAGKHCYYRSHRSPLTLDELLIGLLGLRCGQARMVNTKGAPPNHPQQQNTP